MTRLALLLASAVVAVPFPSHAADAVADFFKGKTIRLVVGYPAPSSFDLYARILVRHMPRHVPGNPVMIVQTMPGAGGLNAIGYVANAGARDGTVLALPNPVNTTEPLLDPDHAKFDPRAFYWLGSLNSEISTCGFWNNKASSIEDLRTKELTVGSTGPSSGSTIDVKTLQNIFNYKFRVISGYQSLAEMRLASERGELDGHCGITVTTMKATMWDKVKSGTVKIPIQMGLVKHSDLPDVPNVFDIAEKQEDRQVLEFIFGPWLFGRGVMTPPGLPVERAEALRKAFEATMRDPAFVEDAKRSDMEMQHVSGQRIAEQIAAFYATPKPIIDRIRQIVQNR